jgi:hypothetical protein
MLMEMQCVVCIGTLGFYVIYQRVHADLYNTNTI